MPRPELYPVKKIVGFDQQMIDAIEIWRGKQRPIPNASEAIRWLVEIGLLRPRGSDTWAFASHRTQRELPTAFASSGGATRSERVIRADRQRPEPAQIVGTAAGLIDAADAPLAAIDGVVRAVLVDPGAEAGGAQGQSRHSTAAECDSLRAPTE